MSEPVAVTTRSARADRLRALAPRLAVYAALAILSLAGLRATLRGDDSPAAAARPAPVADLGAEAFAEGFARAYLSFDAARPELRERELAGYLSDDLEPDGGYSPASGARSVSWTAAAGVRIRGSRRTVTVAAQTSAGLVHLAVPVERDGRGFLYVAGYPALVGPPATNTAAGVPSEDEVEDAGLRVVVERAVRNYLAGDKNDLLADLAPDAVVSLPSQRLEVSSIAELTWAEPGRMVAVLVEAEDAEGSSWTLRYELGVRKRDRWYVRSLHVDPRQGGGP